VKRGPKGAGEGGTGELTEGERNGGAKTVRRRRSRRPGTDTRPRREGEGVTGCSARAHEGGREGKERGQGHVGVGDGPQAVPHGGEGWGGAWDECGGQMARRVWQRPGRGTHGRRVHGRRRNRGEVTLTSGPGTVTGGGFESKEKK
jgi:hypothetical protein